MADALRIDPEFSDRCRKLTVQERAKLEAQLETHGLLQPIITWANHDDTIVDGHHRYEICRALGIKWHAKALHFADRQAVLDYIDEHQEGRRNESEKDAAYRRGKKYREEKKPAHRPSKSDTVSDLSSAEIAESLGVSDRTLRRDLEFTDAVDNLHPDVVPDALSDDSGLTRKDVKAIATLPQADQPKAAKAIKQKRKAKQHGEVVKTEQAAKKRADFTAVCRWASGRKQAITADEAAEKFDLSVDAVKRMLNAAAQSQGYLVRQLPKEGRDKDEYRITRAVHFGKLDLPADSAGGVEDMKIAARELRDLALTYRDKTSAKRCSTWTPEEQEKLLSLCITLANAFVEG